MITRTDEQATQTEAPTVDQSELIKALARIEELTGEVKLYMEATTFLALKLGMSGEALEEMVEILRLPLKDRIQRLMAKAG